MGISNGLYIFGFVMIICSEFNQAAEMDSSRLDEKVSGSISSPGCGKRFTTIPTRRKRIVGGKRAELGSWPWMAALGYTKGNETMVSYNCGGVLISDRYVLTAANCVQSLGRFVLSSVRLGDLDLNDTVHDGASPIDVLIDQIISHQNYSASKIKNNIAIIRLKTPVTFNKLIQPLCLPESAELKSDLFASKRPYITGWGSTEFGGSPETHLQEHTVPVVSPKKCKEIYGSNYEIDDTVICAGEDGSDACQGDSGGPLALLQEDTYYLIGITSFGLKCAEKYPGVYTRVSYFMGWIKTNI